MTALNHGLVLLNKKSGFTSYDSLEGVKKVFATKKAGHTGTLDKFASGLLLVLVGRGVKLAPLFSDFAKEYTGTINFGTETDTLDPEGKVIADGPIPSLQDIEAVLPGFRGNILQVPPAYSALHVNGRRAHELVREGKEPEMKKRPVTGHDLEIISWEPPELIIHVRVSAGTYIRSLARDIALAAGSRAYLSALTRSAIGAFRIEDSVKDNGDRESLIKALRPLDRKLFETLSIPYFFLDEKAAEGFVNGKPLRELLSIEETIPAAAAAGVFKKNAQDELLGVLERRNNEWGYAHVFRDS